MGLEVVMELGVSDGKALFESLIGFVALVGAFPSETPKSISLEFLVEFMFELLGHSDEFGSCVGIGVSNGKGSFEALIGFEGLIGLRCYSCLIPRYLTMLGRIPLLIPVLLMLCMHQILVQMVCEDTQASLLSGKRLNFVKLVWVTDGRLPCCSTINK